MFPLTSPWITVHPTGLWSLGCTEDETYKVFVWGVSDVTFQLHFLDLSDNPINGDPIQGKVLIHSPPTTTNTTTTTQYRHTLLNGWNIADTSLNSKHQSSDSTGNLILITSLLSPWDTLGIHASLILRNYNISWCMVVVKFSWVTTLSSLQIWNNSWVKSTSYLI